MKEFLVNFSTYGYKGQSVEEGKIVRDIEESKNGVPDTNKERVPRREFSVLSKKADRMRDRERTLDLAHRVWEP